MFSASVTEIQNYKRCRRRWNYSSNLRMNLTGNGFGRDALELGSLIHNSLAAWMLNPDLKLKSIFEYMSNERISKVVTDYKERVGADISEEELQPIYDIVVLGSAMCENYQQRWGTPIDPQFTFAAAEQEIAIPVPGTEHQCPSCLGTGFTTMFAQCENCSGEGTARHQLTATLDGLLQHKNGLLFVLERKTYHPSFAPSMQSLMMADQFTGYCWVVDQLQIGRVGGIAYDGLKKLSKPARGKSIEDLFIRTIVPKSKSEIDEWGRWLALTLNEMANDPPLYPTIPWDGCSKDCSYMDLCQAQLRGESIDLIIKQKYTQRQITRIQGIRA